MLSLHIVDAHVRNMNTSWPHKSQRQEPMTTKQCYSENNTTRPLAWELSLLQPTLIVFSIPFWEMRNNWESSDLSKSLGNSINNSLDDSLQDKRWQPLIRNIVIPKSAIAPKLSSLRLNLSPVVKGTSLPASTYKHS